MTNASLYLNIIPVERLVPKYDQDQLFYAVEQEYYAIRDQVLIAITELVDDVAKEETLFTLSSSEDAYDSFPLDRAGLNTLPPSASSNDTLLASTFASYNSSKNSISFGLPDGFGPRYGLFGLPIMDNIIAAGTGQQIYPLSEYLGSLVNMPQIPPVSSPTFDAFWKKAEEITNVTQANYAANKARSILSTVSSTVGAFKNFNVNNIPQSVFSTLVSAITKMNFNPLKSLGFFNNAFRGTADVTTLSNGNFANKLYSEKLFGSDKYITPFAASNIIPMDFGDLRINSAKGTIREMALANEMFGGTPLKDMSTSDLEALVFSNYSIDSHIFNRMQGINLGEETLPSIRSEVNKLDINNKPLEIIKAIGFNGEYIPRDEQRGVGGKPGKSDYNPLALGETADGTPIEKREARAKTGISTANGGEISEPKPGYNTKYPNNIVFEKNGIVVEVDSTPGSERVHIYHPSHSYTELDAEGNYKFRCAKDNFQFTDRDLKEFIRSNMDTVINGTKTEKAKEMHIKADMIYINCD